jgi:hypothetical protein
VQRLRRFIREWTPTLAWTRSLSGRILRILLLLYVLSKGGFAWVGITMPTIAVMEISLRSAYSAQPWFYQKFSIEAILVAILLIILMTGTVAVAWFKTTGPKLIVDDQLEEDTFVRVYRLLVHVEGHGTSKPHAYVDVLSEENATIPLRLPGGSAAIELQWSNYLPGQVPEMTSHTPPQSIGIVIEPNKLIVHGNVHHPEIETYRMASREKSTSASL